MTDKKKILIIAMKYAYGDPKQGLSYEWNHIYLGLKEQFQTTFFDFLADCQAPSQEKMQQKLLEEIRNTRPDIIIYMPYTEQFSTEFVSSLKRYAKTFCFFLDDTWRIDYVNRWAPCFDAFSTTNPFGESLYAERGLSQAIFLPDGVNERLFNNRKLKRDIDVSFVGSWHPYRHWLINQLKKTGIHVETYGHRWPNGTIETDKMIEVFNRSKISLNISNSITWDARYMLSYPRGLLNAIRSKKIGDQLKGRHFEIPACGALQMSFYANGLGLVFDIDKEIAVFNGRDDLIELIKYYLKNHTEREKIAEAGYQRTLRDHTYSDRFHAIFKRLGWCS
jgi:spore maturation protein CgeB